VTEVTFLHEHSRYVHFDGDKRRKLTTYLNIFLTFCKCISPILDSFSLFIYWKARTLKCEQSNYREWRNIVTD